MENYVTGSYFDVQIYGTSGGMFGTSGKFSSVSGLGAEFSYETYNEGGSNYPRPFFKETVQQRLVLEQGTVTSVDWASIAMIAANLGTDLTYVIHITLKNNKGDKMRTWTILGAHLVKYEGPTLNANQSEVAVSRIEFIYGGVF